MRRCRVIHARLLSAVQAALPGIEVYSSPSQGIIAWKKDRRVYCFTVRPYDQFAWRLTNRFLKELRMPIEWKKPLRYEMTEWGEASYREPVPQPAHTFELSFLGRELPRIASPGLVRFIESVFTEKVKTDVFKWRPFSHDSSYPGYAWTKLGLPEVKRLQRERREGCLYPV